MTVSLKSHFPIFTHLPDLVYLDSAATSQKPASVIQAITDFYTMENANVHRGLYALSTNATKRYEAVRQKVADLIGANHSNSIAFTKGTTESINIVAHGFLGKRVVAGDKIVISAMEHHANLIPWQQLCKQQNASLEIIPVDAKGNLLLKDLGSLLDKRTKMLAITHISNVLGTINPISEVILEAHKHGIPVLVDAAQSVGHIPVDVTDMDADFLVFSAHKMFGPQGTGVLYCKDSLMNLVNPLNYGGGSVRNVEFENTEFLEYPQNLEAGTANVGGVIGLGAAIDFIGQLDLNEMAAATRDLSAYFKEKILSLGVSLVGESQHFGDIVSFHMGTIHPHDVASFLANSNIAVRAGHHCAQPLLESLGVPATVRASFSCYNERSDVDKAVQALVELKKFWS